jgi:hypothetical protein
MLRQSLLARVSVFVVAIVVAIAAVHLQKPRPAIASPCFTVGQFSIFPDCGPAASDPSVPANWLVQKVCVNSSNVPVLADAYEAASSGGDAYGLGCPTGDTERAITQSDPVPYYHYAYTGAAANNQWYVYSLPNVTTSGETMYVMDRQLPPQYNQSSTWYVNQAYLPGFSHYDTYRIVNGYISNSDTRDTGGFNQIFVGNSTLTAGSSSGTATPYNAWVSFPNSFITTQPWGSSTYADFPITGFNWEQSGDAWPLTLPSVPTSLSTQTTWYEENYTFDSGKTMNTIVSQHQSIPNPSAPNNNSNHMEIWYFTLPYGPSRWEVWTAASCAVAAGSCVSTNTIYCPNSYVGETKNFNYGSTSYPYYLTDCKDYTYSTVPASTGTQAQMPTPESNLLSNFNFATDAVGTTTTVTGWTNSAMTITQSLSSSTIDANGHTGVRFLQSSCSATCSLAQTYATTTGGTYAFGAQAVLEGVYNATPPSGNLTVTLSQVNASGAVIGGTTTTYTQSITPIGATSACNASTGAYGPAYSVILCASYVGGNATVAPATGMAGLQISISPASSGTNYDISDAYLSLI